MGGGGIWTLAVTCLLLMQHAEVLGFGILPGESQNHLEITEEALLNVTVQTCRAISQAEGADFTAPASPFTAKSVAAACGAPKSSKSLKEAITLIQLMNVRVDIRYVLNASFHFDDEHINEGRAIITSNLQAVKAANKQENYEAARKALGMLMHSLQDFYSHSNWVELNFAFPNPNLIRSDTRVGNIAALTRATCRSCDRDNCTNNILEDIISDRVLTTGYFSLNPLAEKPAGKCSHGGAVDLTSSQEPTGGINKDSLTASHGHLHTKAASLATAATSQMLEDVRAAAGDQPFLQMMGITKGSSRGLCIVIDVTESMSDDIQAVRNVTASIIHQAGAANAPALYLLVTFSDPDVGPLVRTTDPNVFMSIINSLSVSGGSDDAEKSLSGLQMALNAAPKSSEVFLFTDAPAKDRSISSTVIALIERQQTVVNFMVTNSTVTNQRRPRAVSDSDLEVYQQLSQVSGGQTVEVRTSELQTAANIIMETSNLSPVTLLQVSRSPGRTQEFSFQVDETVSNLRVFITGRSVTVTVTDPSGSSQVSGSSGSVISSSQTVGNFQSLKLNDAAGAWKIKMESSNPYTLKVLGQSDLDFLFDFVQPSSGSFGGFDVLETRPLAGVNGTLLVSLTGSDVATLTEASLVESSGSATVPGTLALQDDGSYLVTLGRIPLDPFVVRVTGRVDGVSTRASKVFQRQSPTNVRGSNLTITAEADAIIVPGSPFTVPFIVMSSGAAGNVTIRASNSRGYDSTSPSSLLLDGGSNNGSVTLSVPLNTPSGTDVTLVIEAQWPSGDDGNYITKQFTIVNTVTDFTPPVCQLISLQTNCSLNVSAPRWAVSVRVSDGDDGTGVERVSLRQGNGTLSTRLDPGDGNVTLADYQAACSDAEAELLLVDRVGNVGSCALNSRDGVAGANSGSAHLASPLVGVVMLAGLVLQLLRELDLQ
ncbi:von Willebrand factor A domain-containing protein 7-like [Synchiropus splendidus]|uniref:von Willebrand factor A domain-containing protein 7-like n=1 Tax=Synchiropus splendidus TaxID=270530 RepID=UPI00237DC066|nr:von Willebrand factor A domain-containing protein 7-like [Synchiropus splendidus]XP_053703541.1 von Willebrand factor A domain-containing protein 7-like [Synchiropus splendidus]